jgi:hypothetical protein
VPLELRTRPVDFSPIEQLLTELHGCYDETERFLSREFDQLLQFGEQQRQLAAHENGWMGEIRQMLDLLEDATGRLTADDAGAIQPAESADGPTADGDDTQQRRRRNSR